MDIEILGESKKQQGYTVYRNNDTEMVEKIKNIKLPNTHFTGYIKGTFYKNAKFHSKLNDKQNLYVDETDTYFIASDEDISSNNKKDLLKEINKQFSVADALNYTFDNLLNRDGFKHVFYKRPNAGFDELGGVYSETNGYTIFGKCDENDNNYMRIDYITITEKDRGYSMFAYLNEDGNIENRDYNLDITKLLENKVPKNKQQFFDDLIRRIPVGKYLNYGNKYFYVETDTAYVLDFEPYRYLFTINICENNNGKYKNSHIKSFVKPKKLVETTEKDMIYKILSFLNPLNIGGDTSLIDISQYDSNISSKPIHENKSVIDESKYTKKYIIPKDDISDEIADLLNNINIPENDEIIQDYIKDILPGYELPNFDYDASTSQEDHTDFIGLVIFEDYNIYYSFNVEQGACIEASHDGAIFQTDIINLTLL